MQTPRGLSETTRDARPSEIHRLGGLRGGASATAGSANPGGMVAAAMGSVASARDQRRNRIGRGGLGSAHSGLSVSALGYPASGGREERRCRLRAAMGKGAQAGREGLPPLARRERPNDPHNSNFPAGEVGDIERRPHSFVGSSAMAYVSSCHRRRAHRAMGGTRGEHSEGRETHTRDTRKGDLTWDCRIVSCVMQWLLQKRKQPLRMACARSLNGSPMLRARSAAHRSTPPAMVKGCPRNRPSAKCKPDDLPAYVSHTLGQSLGAQALAIWGYSFGQPGGLRAVCRGGLHCGLLPAMS